MIMKRLCATVEKILPEAGLDPALNLLSYWGFFLCLYLVKIHEVLV